MFKVNNIRELVFLTGTVLLGIIEIAVLYFLFPQYLSVWLGFIPVYFLILTVCILHFKHKRLNPRQEINVMMMYSMIPLLLSLMLMLLYSFFIKEHLYIFFCIFVLFYIWFLIMKSVVFYKINGKN